MTVTCGTCAHGTPDGYGMVECQLGWEAHDRLWSDWISNFIPMAHPGVPKPLLSLGHPCVANGGTGHAVRKAA
ncbi:hypothetical protein [Deinococcus yunweiensis]|uniref:hypothetical protein n=1 Tax=Deinococcus yunweiensis TaxID=367282 RepID=UPI00398F5581